jgi:hypothetical protein
MNQKVVSTGRIIFILVFFIGLLFPSGMTVFADDGLPGDTPQPESQVVTDPGITEEGSILPNSSDLPDGVEVVVVDQTGEQLPLASESAAQVLQAPDPYLTSGGVLYSFTATDCDPQADGEQACSDPIQHAIDFAAGGYTPDDGTIYVESGDYNEDLFIASMNDFHLMGVSGSSSTILHGSISMNSNFNLTLSGFTIYGDITAINNYGDIVLEDLVVDGQSSESSGIQILGQDGTVNIDNVHSTNSMDNGLTINNIADSEKPQMKVDGFSDLIYIANSSFNNNNGNGIEIQADAPVVLYGVQANENGNNGAYINNQSYRFPPPYLNDLQYKERINNVVIKNSEFASNGLRHYKESLGGTNQEYFLDEGNGLFVVSDNIFIKNVVANGNGNNGAVLRTNLNVGSSELETADFGTKIKVVCSEFNHNTQYGITGSTEGDIVHKNVKAHGNGEGNVNYDFFHLFTNNTDYICHKETIVEEGSDGNLIPCDEQGLTLQLENKDLARFTGFCNHEGHLVAKVPSNLPGTTPDGTQFGSALEAAAYLNGSYVDILPPGGTIQVEFAIPEELVGKELVIMYWDPGKNAWVELPVGGKEGEFSSSDPARQLLSGAAELANGHFGVTVNFSGIFMLVAR